MSSVVSVNFTISSSRCAHLSPSRSRPKIEIVSVHPSLNQIYLSVLFSKGSLPQIAPPQLLNQEAANIVDTQDPEAPSQSSDHI